MPAAVARMSPNWAWRMGLVTVVFGAFALWCLYDALIGYPQFNQRVAEHNRLLAAGRAEDWPALAAEKGWDPRFAREDTLPNGAITPKTQWDTGTQYVMLAGAAAVAAATLVRILRARGRSMRADDEGFLTIEGVRVPYTDVAQIDLALWQRKSIARVSYRHTGKLAQTVIDDWIYRGGDAVLAELQARTGLGQPPTDPPAGAPAEDAAPGAGSTANGKPDATPDASTP